MIDYSAATGYLQTMQGNFDGSTSTMGQSCDIFGSLSRFVSQETAELSALVQKNIGLALTAIGKVYVAAKAQYDTLTAYLGNLEDRISDYVSQLIGNEGSAWGDQIQSMIDSLTDSAENYIDSVTSKLNEWSGVISASVADIQNLFKGISQMVGQGLAFLSSAGCSIVNNAINEIPGGSNISPASSISSGKTTKVIPNDASLHSSMASGLAAINNHVSTIGALA